MARRKSLARRWPWVVYRVEQDGDKVFIKAWEANTYGRMIKSRHLATGTISEWEHDPVKPCWLTSTDTDAIHRLHEEIRDGLWELDDAIRQAYKDNRYDWEPTVDDR
ncbi:hypothetical protein JOF28_001974 [Leucobacter exalbidus]|uniref:Uncharacterized protein n=1 Tax=Leucobacter exalbidus TaxID=662960 RepID=A0A940PTR5_9MICO|nr:hypothetical protein [Leucobacter exalbidus]